MMHGTTNIKFMACGFAKFTQQKLSNFLHYLASLKERTNL